MQKVVQEVVLNTGQKVQYAEFWDGGRGYYTYIVVLNTVFSTASVFYQIG